MAHRAAAHPRTQLTALNSKLMDWLVDAAYPLWARRGIDARNGGFVETLGQDGADLLHPRRARVQPRQAYAFAQAPDLGWSGDARTIVSRGMNYFTEHYRRPDGFFRTLADADGSPLDERALLYDQAFALLGFAAAAVALDARPLFEARALELRHAIEGRLRASDGAFYSDEAQTSRRESNPHMHLLEACLAWAEIGNDAGWTDWVRSLVGLALTHFIRKDTGAVGESFTADWQPAPGVAGRIIEPGHQFEWSWLLLRCENRCGSPLREPALRLLAIGDTHGVHNGVAVNQLNDDFTVADFSARFWPQSERLKAALLAANLTDDVGYWSMAETAAGSFLPYLDTAVRGLWFDVREPNGTLVDLPAPASTFYHLVGAISVLNSSLRSRA